MHQKLLLFSFQVRSTCLKKKVLFVIKADYRIIRVCCPQELFSYLKYTKVYCSSHDTFLVLMAFPAVILSLELKLAICVFIIAKHASTVPVR